MLCVFVNSELCVAKTLLEFSGSCAGCAETSYARLSQSNPERAAALFAKAEANAKAKYERLQKMGKLYE